MNERQLRRWIESYLLPSLPDFDYHAGLLYRRPSRPLIRGFAFERAMHETNTFFATAIVQPCYVPSEVVVLNLGERLGRISGGAEKWWAVGDGKDYAEVFQAVLCTLVAEGLGYLNERGSLRDVIRTYGQEAKDPHTYLMETVAGAHALLGEERQALRLTEALVVSASKHMEESPWLKEVLLRAEELVAALKVGRNVAARVLEERASFTVRHLGLGS
jgi:hypothetical protein